MGAPPDPELTRKGQLAGVENAMQSLGADPESLAFQGGKLGGEIAGTAGVPVASAARFAYPLRIPLNALSGATAAGMVDPESMGTGAMIGGGLTAIGAPIAAAGKQLYNQVLSPAMNLLPWNKAGAQNIVRNHLANLVGEKHLPATIAAADRAKPFLHGYPMRLDEAMVRPRINPVTGAEELAFLPGGSPLAAMTKIEAAQPGGASAIFGELQDKQNLAIQAAEKARNLITAPMREAALSNANVAGTVGQKLAAKQKVLEDIATSRVEDVRRFSAAGDRAGGRAATTASPVVEGRILGYLNNKPIRERITAGNVLVPGRYTHMGELEKKAGEVAGEAADASLKIGEAARFNKYQLDSLAAHGYYPLTSDSVQASIRALKSKSGNKANTTLQKAMNEISDTLKSVTDSTGIVDANELYTIRKLEAGNVIEKYARENATWDKAFTSGLLKDVQHAIDDAVEQSGGSGWKNYLSEYAKRSKAIDLTVARRELAAKPPQPTSISGGRDVAGDITPQVANMLSRPVMMSNWTLRLLGKAKEPAVDEALARILTNPQEYSRVMRTLKPLAQTQIVQLLGAARNPLIAVSASQE